MSASARFEDESRSFVVRLDVRTLERLRSCARKEQRTLGEVIRLALDEYLDQSILTAESHSTNLDA